MSAATAPQSEAAEGLLLIEYACRLAVKNALVVTALRDDGPLDRAAAARTAATELRHLAAQAVASADRMVEERATARQVGGRPLHEHDYRRTDTRNLVRRERAYREVAERAIAWSRDDAHLDRLVEAARAAAWDEVAAAIEARLDRRRPWPAAGSRPATPWLAHRRVAVGLALLALRRRRRTAAALLLAAVRTSRSRPTAPSGGARPAEAPR